jgi:long-chain fatty acid transport protein
MSHACRGFLVLACCAVGSEAQGGAFEIRAQSAEGFGAAIAGVAAGQALSFSYWNPAALSHVDRFQVEGVSNLVFPSIDLNPSTGGSIDIGKNALVPAMYMGMPLTDRLTAGLSVTSPYGLATDTPPNWTGQIYGRTSKIFSINANPMLSYRVNDLLSVGAGIQIQYFRAKLTQAVLPVPFAPDASLKADSIGVGFNLGMQLKPWAGGTIGVGYRSAITHDLDGHLTLPSVSFPASAKITTPDLVSLGIRQEVTARARVMGTVEWTNWSRIDTVPVVNPNSGGTLPVLPQRYRDGWLFSVGGEYDVNKTVTARAGIGYEIAPVTDMTRDVRLPEPDQLILSAGLSYRYSQWTTFDFALTQSIGLGNGPVTIASGDPRYLGIPFSATSDLNVTIVSAGLKMKFDNMPFAAR